MALKYILNILQVNLMFPITCNDFHRHWFAIVHYEYRPVPWGTVWDNEFSNCARFGSFGRDLECSCYYHHTCS